MSKSSAHRHPDGLPKRPIDKEVVLDAQSKGFASRIVRYHQDSASGRPKASGNLYKSPGDLPIVHLKRNEILFKNRRSNSLSNLRVGRLERNYSSSSECDPNARRQRGGLTGYNPEDAYRQREMPIIIAPSATDAFSGPRSVLDELKEISRKRINKYDAELDVNETKKYCRDVNEVDGAGSSSAPTINQKRQRDPNISPPLGPGAPQQKTKKLCRDSYDVISSLSSSLGLARSRSTVPSTSVSPSAGVSAAKRPATNSAVGLRPSKTGLPSSVTSTREKEPTPPTGSSADTLRVTASVPVMRPVAEPPKLTLFNKDYNTIPVKKKLEDDDDEEGDYGESVTPCPFVRPQVSSPTLAIGGEEKRKAEKNKLALMLRCLAGDFEDSDEEQEKNKDVVDVAKVAPATVSIPAPAFTLPSSVATVPIIPVQKPQQSVVEPVKPLAEPQPQIAQPTAEDNVAKVVTTAPTIVTPAVTKTGFDSPTAAMFTFNKTTPSSSIGQPSVPSSPSITSSSSTGTSIATSPGFKFGSGIPTLSGVTPIVSSSAPATSATITSTASSIPGIFSFPKAPAQVSNPLASAAPVKSVEPSKIPVATFSFGASNPVPAVGAGNNAAPTAVNQPSFDTAGGSTGTTPSPMFSFGATPSKDPTPALLPSTTTTSQAPANAMFSFGGGTTNPVATRAAPVTAAAPPAFSFGNASTTVSKAPTNTFTAFSTGGNSGASPSPFGGIPSTPASTTTKPSATSTATFSFGGASNSNSAAPSSFGLGTLPTSNATPTFGSSTSTATPIFGSQSGTSNTAASTFSFGGTSAAAPAQSSPFGVTKAPEVQKSSTFSFGGSGIGAAALSATTSSSGPAAASPFSFRTNIQTQPSSTPVFGSAINTAPRATAASPFGDSTSSQSTFSFGQSASQPAAAPAPSNAFSFGGSTNAGNAFKFGDNSSNTQPTNAPQANAFNFGSASQPAAPVASSTFAFGQKSSAADGMFNFGAQGDPNGGGAPAFNIGSGGGGPPRRPIRQATRRMK